jgi:hypothetical protein
LYFSPSKSITDDDLFGHGKKGRIGVQYYISEEGLVSQVDTLYLKYIFYFLAYQHGYCGVKCAHNAPYLDFIALRSEGR